MIDTKRSSLLNEGHIASGYMSLGDRYLWARAIEVKSGMLKEELVALKQAVKNVRETLDCRNDMFY